jgi:hypothetical protein
MSEIIVMVVEDITETLLSFAIQAFIISGVFSHIHSQSYILS